MYPFARRISATIRAWTPGRIVSPICIKTRNKFLVESNTKYWILTRCFSVLGGHPLFKLFGVFNQCAWFQFSIFVCFNWKSNLELESLKDWNSLPMVSKMVIGVWVPQPDPGMMLAATVCVVKATARVAFASEMEPPMFLFDHVDDPKRGFEMSKGLKKFPLPTAWESDSIKALLSSVNMQFYKANFWNVNVD